MTVIAVLLGLARQFELVSLAVFAMAFALAVSGFSLDALGHWLLQRRSVPLARGALGCLGGILVLIAFYGFGLGLLMLMVEVTFGRILAGD
ncbi:MAG: hypothetical protein HYX69_02995 [Planctomycetia bacterium]|nr:hypothetical protein [Planctomycetia bacterium]